MLELTFSNEWMKAAWKIKSCKTLNKLLWTELRTNSWKESFLYCTMVFWPTHITDNSLRLQEIVSVFLKEKRALNVPFNKTAPFVLCTTLVMWSAVVPWAFCCRLMLINAALTHSISAKCFPNVTFFVTTKIQFAWKSSDKRIWVRKNHVYIRASSLQAFEAGQPAWKRIIL